MNRKPPSNLAEYSVKLGRVQYFSITMQIKKNRKEMWNF
jgi:hypothetical protein